jgi:hypothetical protein
LTEEKKRPQRGQIRASLRTSVPQYSQKKCGRFMTERRILDASGRVLFRRISGAGG